MKKGKILKRVGAMFLTAALALTPMTSALATTINTEAVDYTAVCSITVHKYLSSVDPTVAGSGLAPGKLSSEEQAALAAATAAGAGIEFTLKKVDSSYNLYDDDTKTYATVDDALANLDSSFTTLTGTTNSSGIIEFTGLEVGYYVLQEVAGTVPAGYEQAAAAIIAVPYAVDGAEWNYEVHVYPKNVSDKELVKENVEPEKGYAVGDTVNWEFTSKIDIAALYKAEDTTTTPATPAAFGTYSIEDELDSRLDFDASDITTGKMSVEGVVSGGANITMVLGTDVVCTYTAAPSTLTWRLTEAGIKKLADANATGLKIKFETTINDTAYTAGSDEIKNGGTLNWENAAGDKTTKYEIEEDDKPIAKLYNVVIDKVDGTSGAKLNGAVFKIATTKEDAIDGNFIQDDNGDDIIVTTANHIITPADSSATPPVEEESTDGWAMFAGLPLTVTDPATDTDYYLIEVTAPTTADGAYVRNMDPIKVTIYAEELSGAVTIKNFLPDAPDIPAQWKLPLTGGTGTVLFYVIGAIIMLGCVAAFAKSRKAKASR